jgi:hypothetical protein
LFIVVKFAVLQNAPSLPPNPIKLLFGAKLIILTPELFLTRIVRTDAGTSIYSRDVKSPISMTVQPSFMVNDVREFIDSNLKLPVNPVKTNDCIDEHPLNA